MGKHKDGKKHKKGSQFVIRVDKAERDAFVSLCDALDTSAAREIRRFMRNWVATNSPKAAEAREEAAVSTTSSETAPAQERADIASVKADKPGIEVAGPVIAIRSRNGDAEEAKPRRKPAKRL